MEKQEFSAAISLVFSIYVFNPDFVENHDTIYNII